VPIRQQPFSNSDAFVTAHDDPAVRVQALKGGAVDFLSKPFNADVLLSAIHAALDRKEDA
jgi:FixJ family two-component response regulator